jgi:two-component system response regulator RegX3
MNTSKAHILIVEDDRAILNGLSDVLVFNGYSVEKAEDGGDGLNMILERPFDLVLLDVMLPTMDGFSVCAKVRAEKPAQPIIMITAKGAEDDIVTGFKAGADDYVPKPFSLRELIVRVEAVLRRSGKNLGDERIEWQGIVFDGTNLRAQYKAEVIDLTRREMDIMVYLHRYQDRIVSKKELLTKVWHYVDADIETRTVDIHMLKLRKKLTMLTDQPELIETVRGEGYRLCSE